MLAILSLGVAFPTIFVGKHFHATVSEFTGQVIIIAGAGLIFLFMLLAFIYAITHRKQDSE